MIKSLREKSGKRSIDSKAIILIFALLHAFVAIVSRLLDYYDAVPLTVLTITMVIVVAMRQNVKIEIIAIITLVATMLGFVIGELMWPPVAALVGDKIVAPAISTFIITILIGWGTYAITHNGRKIKTYGATWRLSIVNILTIALLILLLRVLYVVIYRIYFLDDGTMMATVRIIFGNILAILILSFGNIVLAIKSYPYLTYKPRKVGGITHAAILISTIFGIPLLTSVIAYYDVPMFNLTLHDPIQFARIFAVVFLIHIIIYTLVYLVQYNIASKRELIWEREQKHKALYQYNRLKQQINPHFLFNSLNILDYLVQEGRNQQASGFIRKLANIYRYMLNNDQKPLVKLKEELEFADLYIDLLKERFVDGLIIEKRIDPALCNRYIVPCSLQLLIENATKHNIVNSDEPLRIDIYSHEGHIVVKNNLQPRINEEHSTRLGLTNIRQQYAGMTRSQIIIDKTDKEFIVKLPLV